jgi:hypothetical protein
MTAHDIPANTWTLLGRDADGARRHSALRYVEDGDYFLLWGYLSYNVFIYGGPHVPRTDNPEYDIVVFDPQVGAWRNQFPLEKEEEWSRQLPPMYLCQSYHGITTGSYRPQLKEREGILRPDLNIVFDQVAYDSRRSRLVYFSGGRTLAYDVRARQWSDIARGQGPPPVLGGSLCYDVVNDEMVLAGGGHVAETGADGRPVGYAGTWIYSCGTGEWRRLDAAVEPSPRMATRLISDVQNQTLVLFGGDAQTDYLADTWIYDLGTRSWRLSAAPSGPPPRAGHFTVYDQQSGWVIIGGGYSRQNLSDMWAYSVAEDCWRRLQGEVPVGWYITADMRPRDSLIVLMTATESEETGRHCDQLFLKRTTYGFRVETEGLVDEGVVAVPQQSMAKRSESEQVVGTAADPLRRAAQAQRLDAMPHNEWVLLADPGRAAPLRTWGSCDFDTDRGQIVYWGGGHCGYGGNDYDFYDVAEHTWISSSVQPDYPARAWNRGINLAGVTFAGAPWVRHGRKVYAYDAVSGKIVNTKLVYLTAGYDPDALRAGAPIAPDFGTGEDFHMSGYTKWVTWTYDPETEEWDLLCGGLPGLDLTVSTPHGVMAIDHNWGAVNSTERPDRVEYAGQQVVENAVYLLDVAQRRWRKLSGVGPWPQNLYEMTALVYDERRNSLILHGGGAARDELWTFDLDAGRWTQIEPELRTPDGRPPACRREAIYLADEDVLLTCSCPAGDEDDVGVYLYDVGENVWSRLSVAAPPEREMWEIAGQNRAMTYDPERGLILMVLGEESRSDRGRVMVYALRYRHSNAAE